MTAMKGLSSSFRSEHLKELAYLSFLSDTDICWKLWLCTYTWCCSYTWAQIWVSTISVWVMFSCEYWQSEKSFDDCTFSFHTCHCDEVKIRFFLLCFFLLTSFCSEYCYWCVCMIQSENIKILLVCVSDSVLPSQMCWILRLIQLIQSSMGLTMCFNRGQILPVWSWHFIVKVLNSEFQRN